MIKLLITGSSGFVGRNLIRRLSQDGNYEIYTLDINEENNLNHFKADLTNSRDLSRLRDFEFNVVIHLAAQTDVIRSLEDPIFDLNSNVVGTINLLQSLNLNRIDKIIYANSGGAIYGDLVERSSIESDMPNPTSPYGLSKLAAENYLKYYSKILDFKLISLAFSNIYGPKSENRKGIIYKIYESLDSGNKLILNGLETSRDFIYIDDCITAIECSINHNSEGRFNISSGNETNLKDLYDHISKILNKDSNYEIGFLQEGEIRRSCLNNELASKILNWNPTINLDEGLRLALL